jgi:hypothetical protein
LEPLAVDAAMEDDTLPILTERGTRRDPERSPNEAIALRHPRRANLADSQDAELLDSLAEQLDLLNEQQRQIRQLLDQAGHIRLDVANA